MHDQQGRGRHLAAALAAGGMLLLHPPVQAADLSLAAAIDTALSANTGLRITRAGEQTADADLRQARGRNSISAQASNTLRTSRTDGGAQQTSNGVSVSATLPLYSGGANEAAIRAGESGVRAAQMKTARAREELRYEVIAAYWNAAEARQKIAVQRETVDKYDAHLKNVSALYDAGAQAKIDVLRSSVELSNARQELIRAENSYEVNLAALRSLLNISPTEPIRLTSEVVYEPFTPAVADCIAYAYRSRLDLAAQRETLAQQEHAVDTAKAGGRMAVNLTLGTGLTSQFRPAHDSSREVSAGLNVSWNVFDSGVTRAKIEAAQTECDIALLNVRKKEEEIDLALRKAYLNMREAERRFQATGDAVRQAEEDAYIAGERYRAGEGILLDVVDAQLALSTARTNDISARYDYARYRAQVESLMGTPLTDDEEAAAARLPQLTAQERAASAAASAEAGTSAAAQKGAALQ